MNFWLAMPAVGKKTYGFLRRNLVTAMYYWLNYWTFIQRRWRLFAHTKRRQHAALLVFLKAWLEHPLLMGAVVPSSAYLAREMAAHCDINCHGIFVELGGGTGVVTAALLQAGIHPTRLIVVEYQAVFAAKLRQQFPGIRVIQGDAANLVTLLHNESRPICAIISSLPLRTLPPALTVSILHQIATVLPAQSKFIQFTYSFCQHTYPALAQFRQIASKRIWRNLPPARVDVWQAS